MGGVDIGRRPQSKGSIKMTRVSSHSYTASRAEDAKYFEGLFYFQEEDDIEAGEVS